MCTENHVCSGRIQGSQLREGANAGQHTYTALPPSNHSHINGEVYRGNRHHKVCEHVRQCTCGARVPLVRTPTLPMVVPPSSCIAIASRYTRILHPVWCSRAISRSSRVCSAAPAKQHHQRSTRTRTSEHMGAERPRAFAPPSHVTSRRPLPRLAEHTST